MIWVLLQSESSWQRNDAIWLFIYLCVSLHQEFFFLKKSLKGVCTWHSCLNYCKVWTNFMRAFSKYFETKVYPHNWLIFKENDKLWKRGFIWKWFDSIENCVQKQKGIALDDREEEEASESDSHQKWLTGRRHTPRKTNVKATHAITTESDVQCETSRHTLRKWNGKWYPPWNPVWKRPTL